MKRLTGRGEKEATKKKDRVRGFFHGKGNKEKIVPALSYTNSRPVITGASIFLLMAPGTTFQLENSVTDAIATMGGRRVHTIAEASHTMLLCAQDDQDYNDDDGNAPPLNKVTLESIAESQQRNVPVVGVSWLHAAARLKSSKRDHHHWSSRINVNDHIPVALQVPKRGRRDSTAKMGASLNGSYTYMTKENPGDVEDAAVRRAIELSMLDLALVFRPTTASASPSFVSTASGEQRTPHQVLGVPTTADSATIKAAYKRKARETHPDKGGSAGEFEAVARAYRSLLRISHEPAMEQSVIKNTAHWDNELRDHQTLVNELFQNHESDLGAIVAKLDEALNTLGLYAKEAGASNINEKNERISNSCFYLSLATSYLHGIGALSTEDSKTIEEQKKLDEHDRSADEALIGETALDLKRTIEAAVVNAHPEWAEQGKVGEEVQAFSDFLVYILDSVTILSDWAVVVFDSASGFVDIYKGKNYRERDRGWAQSNTITLRYTPGHYQPLLPRDGCTRPDLGSLLQALDSSGLFYVVTDGSNPDEDNRDDYDEAGDDDSLHI